MADQQLSCKAYHLSKKEKNLLKGTRGALREDLSARLDSFVAKCDKVSTEEAREDKLKEIVSRLEEVEDLRGDVMLTEMEILFYQAISVICSEAMSPPKVAGPATTEQRY